MCSGWSPPLTADELADELGLFPDEDESVYVPSRAKYVELSARMKDFCSHQQATLKSTFLAEYAPEMIQSYRLALEEYTSVEDTPRLDFFTKWIHSSKLLLQTLFLEQPDLLPDVEESMRVIIALGEAIFNPYILGTSNGVKVGPEALLLLASVLDILQLFEAIRYRQYETSPLLSPSSTLSAQVSTFSSMCANMRLSAHTRHLCPLSEEDPDSSEPAMVRIVKGAGVLSYRDECAYEGYSSTPCTDDPPQACARCRSVAYCSPEHQRAHWKDWHKHHCLPPIWIDSDSDD